MTASVSLRPGASPEAVVRRMGGVMSSEATHEVVPSGVRTFSGKYPPRLADLPTLGCPKYFLALSSHWTR